MYHLDVNCEESPDFAIVNDAPLEPYVGFPCGVKLSEAPCVKSMLTDFPRAESAGQPLPSRGLQLEYVCATVWGKRSDRQAIAVRIVRISGDVRL